LVKKELKLVMGKGREMTDSEGVDLVRFREEKRQIFRLLICARNKRGESWRGGGDVKGVSWENSRGRGKRRGKQRTLNVKKLRRQN